MLITFLLLGKFLESAAKGRASSAISQLLNLQPPTALQLTTCKDIEQAARRGGRLWLRRGHVRDAPATRPSGARRGARLRAAAG